MDISRRSFLKGSAVLGAAALVGGISLLDAEKEVGKTLYFFPSEIKLTNTYTDSNYFIKVEELVPESQKYSTNFWDVGHTTRHDIRRHQTKVLRREIFDREQFYASREAILPLRVEYIPIKSDNKVIL